ncbi:DUF58 domain-containing protein [Kribbia dieselivorans]|uniref:DUF58 domain-containing protein n=1 Tax=Kribbia dieselivorans TaxID=331526 RepID=UPI0008398B29|nr:DUF58 domain-containing protein [Kribbia dieselivorans]
MARFSSVLTLRGRSLLTAGLTLVACGTVLGFHDLTRIGILVIVLPIVAALRARRHSLNLVVTREVTPHRVEMGHPSEIHLTIENRDRRTAPLLLAEEGIAAALGAPARFVLPRMGPGEKRELRYRVTGRRRGRHELGPLTVQVKDPFDLVERRVEQPTRADVVVLPQVHPLPPGTHLASGAGGEGAVPQHVALHGEDDIAIREYRYGDDLRRIHWPSTARTGEVMMRQEERPAQRRSVVLLDTRALAHGVAEGAQTSESLEWAVSAAASVITHLERQRFSVHLLTSTTVEDHAVHSGMGLDDALDVLAMVTPSADENLDALVLAADALTLGGGVVIAVTGELDPVGAQALAGLRRPGVQTMALVLDGPAWAGSNRRVAELGETARLLGARGWSVASVGPTTEVPQAWAALSGRRSVMVR